MNKMSLVPEVPRKQLPTQISSHWQFCPLRRPVSRKSRTHATTRRGSRYRGATPIYRSDQAWCECSVPTRDPKWACPVLLAAQRTLQDPLFVKVLTAPAACRWETVAEFEVRRPDTGSYAVHPRTPPRELTEGQVALPHEHGVCRFERCSDRLPT